MEFDQAAIVGRILERNPFKNEGELAKRLDMAPNTWTAYKSGKQSFRLQQIAEICDVLGVDVSSILFGNAPVMVDQLPDEFVRVPVYDVKASAGHGRLAVHQMPVGEVAFTIDFLRRLGANPETCYAIEARGDSMWPTISDGAMLIADASQQVVDDGRVYHFNVNERVVVKRARWRMDGRLYLTSDNVSAGVPDESFAADRIDDLYVGGRIVFVGQAPLPVR